MLKKTKLHTAEDECIPLKFKEEYAVMMIAPTCETINSVLQPVSLINNVSFQIATYCSKQIRFVYNERLDKLKIFEKLVTQSYIFGTEFVRVFNILACN